MKKNQNLFMKHPYPTSEARTPTYYKPATSNERSKVSASKGGFPRPPWRSVKKNRVFPVKNEKLFERSEFFLFSGEKCRSSPKSADGEFSLFRFFCSGKRNENPLQNRRKKQSFFLQTFSLTHKEKPTPFGMWVFFHALTHTILLFLSCRRFRWIFLCVFLFIKFLYI